MNKDDRRGQKENMRATCAIWSLLCVSCMIVMLLFASNKTIVIADVSRDQTALSVNTAPGTTPEDADFLGRVLELSKGYGVRGSLHIPLPKGVKAENVVVENRYMDRELWIYIQSDEAQFYRENGVDGDISPILSGRSEEKEDGILLKLKMNRVLEYKSTMESGALTVAWYEPDEVYDFIVVLDPAGGGTEDGITEGGLSEKNVTLEVARAVQRKFARQNVRLYVTRTEDMEVSAEDRINLADEVDADMYIRLCAGADADSSENYGIKGFYNEEYYIPGFGSVDLSNTVLREVTIASKNRALGLETAAEDSILKYLRMPATEVSLGFFSNPQERALLGQEGYREKLADGIIAALEQAVTELELIQE